MEEKLILMSNAGYGGMSYFREKLAEKLEADIAGFLTGEPASTYTTYASASAWGSSISEKSLLDSIYEAEAVLRQHKWISPLNKPIIENDLLRIKKQTKFLRCNKKKWSRVKRWAKNSKNFAHVPDPHLYVTKEFVACHPALAREIKKYGPNRHCW